MKEKIKYIKCKCGNINVVSRKTDWDERREELEGWYEFIWFCLVFTTGVLFGATI